MSEVDQPGPPVELDPGQLAGLSSDEWAAVLVALKATLADRAAQGGLEPAQAAVAGQPTSRLVSGGGRTQVEQLLTGDGILARAVLLRTPPAVRATVTAPEPATAPAEPTDSDGSDSDGSDSEVVRARGRARALRADRDDWRRRAEGAEARAGRAERALAAAQAAQREAEDRVRALRERLEAAGAERERAIARERRRRDAEVARLTEEVAELRRAEESRRADRRRRLRAEQQRAATSPQAREQLAAAHLPAARPTRLPSEIAPGTTEAAQALLGPGRLVLIDGYNVTRQHRDHLDLEGQRTWLLQLCANAVPRLRIRPIIVFDGQQAGGGRPALGRQQVEVRFTPAGITADDELVLAVEATDEPVVVVTDDRELSARVGASGADVVGTVAFLGVVRR
ncbi:MAG: NYN domain-containing protein [Nitriliruptoraceae bacterium]